MNKKKKQQLNGVQISFEQNTARTLFSASIVSCFCFVFLPRKHQQIIKLQPINRNEKEQKKRTLLNDA